MALGVCAAAATPVIADAQPSDGESSDTSSPSSGPKDSAGAAPPSASATAEAPSAATDSAAVSPSSAISESATQTDPKMGIVQATGGANTSVTTSAGATNPSSTSTHTPDVPAPDLALEPPTEDASTTAPTRAAQPKSNRNSETASEPASAPVAQTRTFALASPSMPSDLGSAGPTSIVATALAPSTVSVPSTVNVQPPRSIVQTLAPVSQPVSTAPVTPASIVTQLVTRVLSWIGLGPAANTIPTAPPQTPILWAVLGWVRREFGLGYAPSLAAATPTVVPALSLDSVPTAAVVVQSPNLLLNAGAELGDPSLSGYASVSIPGWTVTGTPTVINYGTLRRLPGLFGTKGPTLPACLGFPSSNSAPPGSGTQFFGGGNVATSTLTQTVDLTGAASEIDNGAVPYTLSADLGGYLFDPSAASVEVDFLDANNVWLGSGTIGRVTALDRWLQTGLLARESSGAIPVGTRSAKVVVTLTDCNPVLGNYNNAYADNLSFTVGADLPAPSAPTPPVSTVGALDHVFIVYMENHGSTDIVGSPNAPYLNSLIDAYGYAADYYGLTHPSSPNYYPILGGSDFGVNYNCAANCFDQRNLADNIEAAHKTWAAYQLGGGGYSTPTDRTPFLAFSDIYNNPARVASHIFDVSQMATDLADSATTPNFAWLAADEATNMEGPISNLQGIVSWAISQLTTHQYNVKAGDEFLQSTLPIIFNSAVWQDPTQKSAIFLTFDEDFNNISWGIGNQGNHVVMVVIPSPGAVAAGMRGGAFTANDYYNHYSLQRTIEESLGLPPLTNNDKYAQPMNEFWT